MGKSGETPCLLALCGIPVQVMCRMHTDMYMAPHTVFEDSPLDGWHSQQQEQTS